jgi:glycosyltransferase involved in cell wall biosynthesis
VHKVTEILARGLQDRGHEIVVFGYPGGMLEERMHGVAPFEPILKGMDFHPLVLSRARRALRRHRTDVVLAMMRKDVTLTAPAAKSAGVPVVVRHANQQPLGNNVFWRLLYGAIPEFHVANAEATKQTLLSSARWMRGDQVRVIYNGIDPKPFENAVPMNFGLPDDAIIAGFAGSFEARKGVRELAQAWRGVASAIPNAHLVLVGKGSREAEMRFLLDDSPRVHWAGYQRDATSALRSFDVLVLPSYREGAPNIVLEAMCAGAAVVATAVSGTPELVRDRLEAKLIASHDVDGLRQAMIELMSNAGLRERLASAAKARVLDKFGLSHMIDAYEETLLQAVRREVPAHASGVPASV